MTAVGINKDQTKFVLDEQHIMKISILDEKISILDGNWLTNYVKTVITCISSSPSDDNASCIFDVEWSFSLLYHPGEIRSKAKNWTIFWSKLVILKKQKNEILS